MSLRTPTALIIAIFFSTFTLPAQKYLIDVKTLTKEDGLSHLKSNSIFKDSQGYIWIGTDNGLNRYDGYNFKHYPFPQEYATLDKPANIYHLTEDDKGNIWFYVLKSHLKTVHIFQIHVLNTQTEKIISLEDYLGKKLPFLGSEIALPIITDPKNRIWIPTKNGELFLYKGKGVLKKIYKGPKGGDIQNVRVDKKDNIWLKNDSVLIKIDTTGKVLDKLDIPYPIFNFWIGKHDELWIASFTNKKMEFWQKKEGTTLIPHFFTKNNRSIDFASQGSERPIQIFRSPKGYWYITGQSYFDIFNEKGEWIYNLKDQLADKWRFSVHGHFAEENNIWVTTSSCIIKLKIDENPFKLCPLGSTSFKDYRGITEDKQGNIFFINQFIYQWNTATQQVKQVYKNGGGMGAILYKDSIVLIGTYDDKSLVREYNFTSKKELNYPPPNERQKTPLTYLQTDNANKFLVGTYNGLCYFDIAQKTTIEFVKYNEFELLKDAKVNHIYKNKSGIWLATSQGMFLMQEEVGVIGHYDVSSGDLAFDNIRHIHEDEQGVFWLSTFGGGIIKWLPPTKVMNQSVPNIQLTTAEGLSHNNIYAIYEDEFERLWIPSDKGLMLMDKKSLEVITFMPEDGLPHSEFNHPSHYQAKDGTLYFGGLGGLISFHPTQFPPASLNKTPLKFISYHLLEDGAEDMIDKTFLLREKGAISIKPDDKLFELRFNLLDYDNTERHSYKYRIKGYNDNWQHITENFIRITSLPYGDYTLEIKGRNDKTGWSNQKLSLDIHILWPFYLQWWFIVLVLLLLTSGVLLSIKWREAKLQADKKRLEIEVEQRTHLIARQAEELEQLDKAKTRFFSNMTHEFRTPLTLIIGPLEQVMADQPPPTILRRRMKSVLKNAQHLLTLINQMLDISKLESGEIQIEVFRGDIIGYSQELVSRFHPLIEKKGIRLSFASHLKKWDTQFDQKKWDKIIYNLLSNAIKFTEAGGFIQLSVAKTLINQQTYIRLDIKDTGIGISQDQVDQIFNRFYQVDSSSTRIQGGTGIGLALVKELVELQGGKIYAISTEGQGTSFEVYLPVLESSLIKPIMPFSAEKEMLFPRVEDESPLPKQPSETNDGHRLDLLIIEDNAEMREYIRHCLDENVYNILEAENGAEGIEKAHALIPDLIISDVMMPKKNGFAVTEAIRNHVGTSHIPLILLTAKTSLESRLKGWKRGADAYLTKPFSPQELVLRIQKLIEIRRLLQKRYQTGEISITQDSYQQEDVFIRKLKDFVLAHIDEPNLNGDHISEHFSMSRVHLHRKLKALTDYSIGEFVKKVRLEKALTLLQEGELNVSEISYDIGFSSVSHFSREFKKMYGISPSKMKSHK